MHFCYRYAWAEMECDQRLAAPRDVEEIGDLHGGEPFKHGLAGAWVIRVYRRLMFHPSHQQAA